MQQAVTLRLATIEDIPDLNRLIHLSARELSLEHYSKQEIESLIEYVFGVDKELILDKTYYILEQGSDILACGGWSKRRTLFGGSQCVSREAGYLDPKHDLAKIRAFFVHPDFARKGLAKMLIEKCESEARLAGFSKVELMSTLPGIRFYQNQGYTGVNKIEYAITNGVTVELLPMTKILEVPA